MVVSSSASICVAAKRYCTQVPENPHAMAPSSVDTMPTSSLLFVCSWGWDDSSAAPASRLLLTAAPIRKCRVQRVERRRCLRELDLPGR